MLLGTIICPPLWRVLMGPSVRLLQSLLAKLWAHKPTLASSLYCGFESYTERNRKIKAKRVVHSGSMLWNTCQLVRVTLGPRLQELTQFLCYFWDGFSSLSFRKLRHQAELLARLPKTFIFCLSSVVDICCSYFPRAIPVAFFLTDPGHPSHEVRVELIPSLSPGVDLDWLKLIITSPSLATANGSEMDI